MTNYEKAIRNKIFIKISIRECLDCDKNLDHEFKERGWHIPLCKEHRMKYLEENR